MIEAAGSSHKGRHKGAEKSKKELTKIFTQPCKYFTLHLQGWYKGFKKEKYMKSKEEVEEQLYYVRHQIYKNGKDVNVWEKVEKYLKWVIED